MYKHQPETPDGEYSNLAMLVLLNTPLDVALFVPFDDNDGGGGRSVCARNRPDAVSCGLDGAAVDVATGVAAAACAAAIRAGCLRGV